MPGKLYLITNSHMDPVWIWDRSSGRSSWLNTIYSTIRLMDENPDIKFSCSSASLYRWIEECDAGLFRRIAELVAAGRWEIVGGWEVQSDVMLARPETLIHQADSGKKYFQDKFGVDVRIAYNPDAFGHNAGLPKILSLSGFTHYVYTRGNNSPELCRWTAEDGSAVIALRAWGYGTGSGLWRWRDKLNAMLEFPQAHIPCFWGGSDHGGGISRQELALVREYQQEHDIVFATMAEYFDVVKDLPMEEFSGEIGPVFRGCYSNCHEVKRKISRAVRRMNTAQRLGVEVEKLSPAWRELLFHHFHDILPGTSVRRAFERDIFTGLGMVEHQADLEIDRALFRRSCSVESSFLKQGGIYCRNLHTFKFRNVISMDGFTDPDFTGKNFNVLRDAQGNEYPLQILPAATSYGPCGVPWGRLTATVELPAFGEKVLAYGVTDKDFGRTGFERQHELLRRLSFEMYPDDSRTWGFELEKFSGTPEKAVLSEVRELCDGAVCSVLQAFYRIGNSSVRVDLYSWRDLPEMGVHIALDWHDESSCVKLVLEPRFAVEEFFTGGGAAAVCRPADEEFAMIDWCAAAGGGQLAAFFAPDLHSCDMDVGRLRLTVNRPVLYSDHAPFEAEKRDGWMDMGNGFRDLWIAEYDDCRIEALPRRAYGRLNNGESREITGRLPSDCGGAEELVPLEIGNEAVVVPEIRKNENGETEIILINYREAAVIRMPDGEEIEIPAGGLTRYTVNKEKMIL